MEPETCTHSLVWLMSNKTLNKTVYTFLSDCTRKRFVSFHSGKSNITCWSQLRSLQNFPAYSSSLNPQLQKHKYVLRHMIRHVRSSQDLTHHLYRRAVGTVSTRSNIRPGSSTSRNSSPHQPPHLCLRTSSHHPTQVLSSSSYFSLLHHLFSCPSP